MSEPGLGVMLSFLSGNEETINAHNTAKGKVIQKVSLDADENQLILKFTDDTGVYFWDDGQSCCEKRYMRTDDNLPEFSGATFIEAEVRSADSAPKKDQYDEEHDIQFLVVKTDRGNITCSSHNEHNGYYGGFAIIVRPIV